MLDSGLPRSLAEDEVVCHFLHFSSQFTKSHVLYGAFFPPVHQKPLQVSVFRTIGYSDGQIWDLGQRHIPKKGEASLKARADISVNSIIAESLKVESSEPPQRHSDILGWPEPTPPFDGKSGNKIAKDTWLGIATQLARKSKLVEIK